MHTTVSSFRNIENKYDVYSGKYCMKKFCEFLREYAIKIILKRKNINKVLKNINKGAAGLIRKCKKPLCL